MRHRSQGRGPGECPPGCRHFLLPLIRDAPLRPCRFDASGGLPVPSAVAESPAGPPVFASPGPPRGAKCRLLHPAGPPEPAPPARANRREPPGRSLRQITTWPGALPISPHPWLRAILRSREPAARAVRLTLAWPGARAAQPLPLLRPGPPLRMPVDAVPGLRQVVVARPRSEALPSCPAFQDVVRFQDQTESGDPLSASRARRAKSQRRPTSGGTQLRQAAVKPGQVPTERH